MSKKRASGASRRTRTSSARSVAQRAPEAPAPGFRTYATAGAAAFLALVLLTGWTGYAPYLVAPLVAGVLVALVLPHPRACAQAGGAAGLLAAAVSVAAYSMPELAVRAEAAPSDTNIDIPRYLYQIAGALAQHNPLNSLGQPVGPIAVFVSCAAGTAVVAWAASTAMRAWKGEPATLRRAVSAGVVALVCASLFATIIGASPGTMAYADQEPKRGRYAFDASVYLKTYYNMLDGSGYYHALVDAAAGDARVLADKEKGIRGGKSYGGWLWGPAAMRRPTIFYVWRYLSPGEGSGIIYLAAAFAAISLGVLYWGLVPYLSDRAAFVPVFVMPYVLFMSLSVNVFLPDFWAALLLTCALALVMRRQWVASAVVFLAASAVREALGPALAVIAALLAVVWLIEGRGREWLVRAASFAGATVAWLGFERLHDRLGARYMAVPYPSALQLLETAMRTRTFAEKVIRPTQYLIFPYGQYFVPGLVIALIAPVGFWAVLASRRDVRLVVVGYTVFWLVFLFIVGATSSYWGQMIMLPSLVGVGALVVSSDRLDRRLEMVEAVR